MENFDFEQLKEYVLGTHINLPCYYCINTTIYRIHLDHIKNDGSLLSVLTYRFSKGTTEGTTVGIKTEMIGDGEGLNLSCEESKFLNDRFFEIAVKKSYEDYKGLLNEFFKYSESKPFQILTVLKDLIDLDFSELTDDKIINGVNLNYSKFKDIVIENKQKLDNHIKDKITLLKLSEQISKTYPDFIKSYDIYESIKSFCKEASTYSEYSCLYQLLLKNDFIYYIKHLDFAAWLQEKKWSNDYINDRIVENNGFIALKKCIGLNNSKLFEKHFKI